MAHSSPPLRILAQPKASHRERYLSEVDPSRSRTQRFVRADPNPDKLDYPTVEVQEI
jgi:hypothetical protein